jgi:hypothetical protein
MTKVSTQRLRDAINGSGGVLSVIAAKVGVSRQAIAKRMKRPELAALLDQEKQAALDRAESQMMRLIEDGDGAMIRFFLSTIGKGRGYTTRSEISADVNGIGAVTIFLPSNGRDEESTQPQTTNITSQEPHE